MNEKNFKKTDFHLWIDIPFMIRLLKKWMFCILCISICAGVFGYIGSDLLMHDTYTVTGLVSVLPKKNTESAYSDWNMGSALTRSVNMWKSNVLRKVIREKNQGITFQNVLDASGDNTSYLIRLSVSSSSTEEAYRIMNTAIHSYTEVADNFDLEYRDVVLTRLNENSVSVEKKNPLLFAILGFGGAMAAMLGVLAIGSMLTGVIHYEEQARTLLNIPLLEILPSVKKKRTQKRLLIGDPDIPMDYREAVDKLTTTIKQHMQEHKQKIVMLASLKENEGKTTIAANLAVNLARRGNKTLLVEMDFRNTSLHHFFEEEKNNTRNISSVLMEEGSLKDAITTRSDEWNLDILWQFKYVDDTDSILENSRIKAQLDVLAAEYDFIVLDTPPVSGFRDANVAAEFCDASILVIRQDYNTAAAVNDVAELLEENGAACMGVVLNQGRASKRRGRFGYSSLYEKAAADGKRKGGTLR